jgi:hypothetical protein
VEGSPFSKVVTPAVNTSHASGSEVIDIGNTDARLRDTYRIPDGSPFFDGHGGLNLASFKDAKLDK